MPQISASKLRPIHRDPTGQVTVYETEERYQELLGQLHGERFYRYRELWRARSLRAEPGDFPLSLDLAVNAGCQLKCRMCPLPSRPERRADMLMDERLFASLMAQAEEYRLPALTFGLASEPLLHPDIVRLIDRAQRAGIMDIRLGTNGLLLSDSLCAALAESGLSRLEISVDAFWPETYRAIRGGSLEKLEARLEEFLRRRQAAGRRLPLLRLSFLSLVENEGELDAFLARWQGLADMVSIQRPIWFPGSKLPAPQRPGRPLAPDCAQSWQRLAVDYDGRFWPCCCWYGEDLLSSNAFEISIARLWRSPELENLRRALSGAPNFYPAPCSRCRA